MPRKKKAKFQTIPESSHRYALKGLVISLLFLTIISAYEQVRKNEFINFDDDVYVTHNLNVQDGLTLRSLPWSFTAMEASHWHPMTWISHMLDMELHGLSPGGHHTTSLLLHIINSVLLFLVLCRMTGTVWKSGFVAALFALHPLNVESVAWVAERKNVLSTLFWMVTIWAYIRYAERPGLGRYLLVLLSFALGLLSKPMLVTIPFVLLLLDYWPLNRFPSGHSNGSDPLQPSNPGKSKASQSSPINLILEKIPLLILSVGSILLTILAAQRSETIGSLELYPLEIRIVNILASYAKYIWKMAWPHRLAVLYPYPTTVPLGEAIGPLLLLICITVLVIRLARSRPYLVVGWFWYLGTLVPVIGLVQAGIQSMADRYGYISLIGLFIMFTWIVSDISGRWRYRKVVLAVSGSVILFVFMIVTRIQVSHWKSSMTLFEHALRVTSDNSRIHNNLGITLIQQGKVHEAISQYKEALRIDPYFAIAHYNIGVALTEQGNVQEAIPHYNEALKIDPNYAAAHNKLGMIRFRQERYQEAFFHFSEALRLKPGHAEVYINIGGSLAALDKVEEAIASYQEALRIKPGHFGAHYNLGNALVRQGRLSEAILHLRRCLQIRPDLADAHLSLGKVYLLVGNRRAAMEEFQILKRLNPELADILSRELTLAEKKR
jgi:Flp pilus assembly protein TadD